MEELDKRKKVFTVQADTSIRATCFEYTFASVVHEIGQIAISAEQCNVAKANRTECKPATGTWCKLNWNQKHS